MSGISEEERLRMEEERLAKTMLNRASGKKYALYTSETAR